LKFLIFTFLYFELKIASPVTSHHHTRIYINNKGIRERQRKEKIEKVNEAQKSAHQRSGSSKL
jgi:hypothetical protein